ncbi:MAG: protein kinase, partial [Chloroflexi bacterium]
MGLIKRVGTKAINPQPPDGGAADEGTCQISPTVPPSVSEEATRRMTVQPAGNADNSSRQIEEQPIGQARIAMPTILNAGTILQGRYLVEGPIGVGGMSVVYRGRDLRF